MQSRSLKRLMNKRRIELCSFEECTGCEACYNACPMNAIQMKMLEGFYHPIINHSLCIKCNACTRSCPILTKPKYPPLDNSLGAFAAYSKDPINRALSSSGGVFSELAKQVISQNGYVFGASFDEEWRVKHLHVSTNKELEIFRGSKYAQSRIEKTYRTIHDLVISNRRVLFSGTPCQAAGLREYLRRNYENLTIVSVFCHGVPSPLAWSRYLSDVAADGTDDIENISFRHKVNGKMPYRFLLKKYDEPPLIERPQDNTYMRAFISGLGLRPSCYNCPFRHKLIADVLIGDFWGIEKVMPEVDFESGVSAVFACSNKGKALISSINSVEWFSSNYDSIAALNPSLFKSTNKHYGTRHYIARLEKESYISLANQCLKPNFPRKVKNMLKRILCK